MRLKLIRSRVRSKPSVGARNWNLVLYLGNRHDEAEKAEESLVCTHVVRVQCCVAMTLQIWRKSLLLLLAVSIQLVPSHRAAAFAGASPAMVASTSGPCSLVTQAEVDTALGKGATISAVHNPRTGNDECRLKPAHSGKIQEIIVVVLPSQGWDMVKKTYVDGKDIKAVSGLGDDAFVGRFIGYNVRKGQKYVKVFGPLTNDNAANDKATRYLAERAASRL
jgi:hypothetical protein